MATGQIDTCISISLSEELLDILLGPALRNSCAKLQPHLPSGLKYLTTHEIVGFLPVRHNMRNNF